MDLKKLLPLNGKTSILEAILSGAQYGGDLWQTLENGQRVLMTILKIEVSPDGERLSFWSLDTNLLKRDRPLYVKFNYRNIIFRLNINDYKLINDQIYCPIPKQAMALDKRRHDRYLIPSSSHLSISLRRTERSWRETIHDLEVRVADVSESGFGIYLSTGNRTFLDQFDSFLLKAIDQRPLPHFIHGKVSYAVPKVKDHRKGDLRIGLALDTSIAEEIFEKLKKKSKMILSA